MPACLISLNGLGKVLFRYTLGGNTHEITAFAPSTVYIDDAAQDVTYSVLEDGGGLVVSSACFILVEEPITLYRLDWENFNFLTGFIIDRLSVPNNYFPLTNLSYDERSTLGVADAINNAGAGYIQAVAVNSEITATETVIMSVILQVRGFDVPSLRVAGTGVSMMILPEVVPSIPQDFITIELCTPAVNNL
jgi:hypothetical protein